MVNWRYGISLEIVWYIGDVVAHWKWTNGVVHWRCGDSWEMVWLIEDVVAHGKWCGSLEMWWLMGNGVVH